MQHASDNVRLCNYLLINKVKYALETKLLVHYTVTLYNTPQNPRVGVRKWNPVRTNGNRKQENVPLQDHNIAFRHKMKMHLLKRTVFFGVPV
jgi:hypothetical protein